MYQMELGGRGGEGGISFVCLIRHVNWSLSRGEIKNRSSSSSTAVGQTRVENWRSFIPARFLKRFSTIFVI